MVRTNMSEEKQQSSYERPTIKVYKRRWIVLIIYILCNIISCFQWIEYCILTNIIMKFYNVSSVAVDWTSIIYMVLYTPLIVPASYIIDKKVSLQIIRNKIVTNLQLHFRALESQ